MSTRLAQADLTEPIRLQRDARQTARAAARAKFRARPVAEDWPATHRDADSVLDLLSRHRS